MHIFLKYSQKHAHNTEYHRSINYFYLLMNFYRIVLFILLTSYAEGAWAQVLKGVVVDKASGEPLSSVTVVNTLTQDATYTNERGEFVLKAKTGEPIGFSRIGYEVLRKSMPPTLSVANMRVELEPMSIIMEDVVIRPGYSPYQVDSIRRRSTYARAIARQKVTSVMSPVSLIADRLSKRSKQIYAFQKSFNHWEGERFIDSRYTPELVQTLTGLSGDTLAHFMNNYPMPYDYARAATELEVKMWIRHNYRKWMARPPQVVDSMNKQWYVPH